jgi:hypothetical protein
MVRILKDDISDSDLELMTKEQLVELAKELLERIDELEFLVDNYKNGGI